MNKKLAKWMVGACFAAGIVATSLPAEACWRGHCYRHVYRVHYTRPCCVQPRPCCVQTRPCCVQPRTCCGGGYGYGYGYNSGWGWGGFGLGVGYYRY